MGVLSLDISTVLQLHIVWFRVEKGCGLCLSSVLDEPRQEGPEQGGEGNDAEFLGSVCSTLSSHLSFPPKGLQI